MTQAQNRSSLLTLGLGEVREGGQGEVDVADQQNEVLKAQTVAALAGLAAAQAEREIVPGDWKILELMLHMSKDNRFRFP